MTATPIDRRQFLTLGVGSAGLVAATRLPGAWVNPGRGRQLPEGLFSLGVASGDPLPDSVILWTRLAPEPLNGGGMPDRPVAVQWQVASDESFRRVVRRGTAMAVPELAHSVHVDVRGLRPGREYAYRFRVGSEESTVGRTRTAPAFDAPVDRLRFAFVSCQDWQNGYYNAFRGLAEEDLDLVVHLGDYIYEYGPEGPVRLHDGPEVSSLESYRNRHALYKTDADLQAVHARFPFVLTWDDHEVENNYAADIREEGATPPDDPTFLARRANGYQAYYEHLPLRSAQAPRGPDLQLYRRVAWGDIAEFSVLDTRQYRSDQPCGDGLGARCPGALSPEATMTGPEQERWLLDGLDASTKRWNVIAQQTILAQYDFNPLPDTQLFNLDQWDGYLAARNRILGFLGQRQPNNPVVITGDIHSSWVFDLKSDFDDPASATVGTEFVGTSITSDFPVQFIAPVTAALPANPHTKFFDGAYRGYVTCDLDRSQWRTDYRTVPTVAVPDQPTTTLASFVVADGQPGAVRV